MTNRGDGWMISKLCEMFPVSAVSKYMCFYIYTNIYTHDCK